MNLKIITAAATEPLTLTEAKLHLKVDNSTDDNLIAMLIKAARKSAEVFTGRALASQVLELILDEFPDGEIILPRPPVESVASIKYKDSDGTETTLSSADYIVFNDADPCEIVCAYGKSWPSFTPYPKGAVRVRYTTGYKTSGSDADLIMPEDIKEALLLTIGNYYENRQDLLAKGHIPKSLPMGAQYLLYPHKTWRW